jgi:hypothetical protein
MWSITRWKSSVGEKSTYSESSSASGAWAGTPVEGLAGRVIARALGGVHAHAALEHVAPVRTRAQIAGQRSQRGSEVDARGQAHEADGQAAFVTHAQLDAVVLDRDRHLGAGKMLNDLPPGSPGSAPDSVADEHPSRRHRIREDHQRRPVGGSLPPGNPRVALRSARTRLLCVLRAHSRAGPQLAAVAPPDSSRSGADTATRLIRS